MSVSQAQLCINSVEFSEWMAYNNIEPITIDRSERMLSILCAIVGNALKGEKVKPLKPEDFMINAAPRHKPKPAEIETKLKGLFYGNN